MKIPPDQMRTKADDKAVKEGCWFDEEAADRAVRFIETYCLPKDGRLAGKAFSLFDWQKDVVRRLFGWMREDGTRRFRTGYISVARQ